MTEEEGPGRERLAALRRTAEQREVPIVLLSPHVLAAVSDVETPQGVVAVVRRNPPSLDSLVARPDLLLLVVDRVQDPGNLGTIIRTADAAGATAAVLLPGTVDLYNPKTVRATMGSLFTLPVVEWPEEHLREILRTHHVRLMATAAVGGSDFREADYRRPIAVAVGNEGEGLRPEWLEAAEAVVHVPIFGTAESLNVAVAAALVLYEAARSVYTDAGLRRAP